MYQILLLDDEPLALETVQSMVNWEELGIGHVLTAVSISAAKQILMNFRIDLVICDVEMPEMDGIEFAKWLSSAYPKTSVMMLTCHADFSFAQRAMQAGSLDYILKPVTEQALVEGVSRAIKKMEARHRMEVELYRWENSERVRKERYYTELVNSLFAGRAVSQNSEKNHQTEIQPDLPCRAVLVLIQKESEEKRLSTLGFNVCESARKLIVGGDEGGVALRLRRDRILVVVEDAATELSHLQDVCMTFIEECNRFFDCDVACCIAEACEFRTLHEVCANLIDRIAESAVPCNAVYVVEQNIDSTDDFRWEPYLDEVNRMLEQHRIVEIADWVEQVLLDLTKEKLVGISKLRSLRRELMVLVVRHLQENGRQVDLLYSDDTFSLLQDRSLYSIGQFMEWLRYVQDRLLEVMTDLHHEDDFVFRLKEYITMHIDEEMNRESLAKAVFLTPDYLSRMFKRRTGMGLNEYIVNRRIDLAKQLLAQTELPVGSIAVQLGYNSFSHFTKVFKQRVGVTPVKYRQGIRNS